MRDGWTYLGELVAEPMFTPQDWEQFVAHHAPPNLLLVAVDETDGVVGYTAVHPDDGEMYLLFVHPAHAGRGIGRTLLAAAHDALQSAGCGEAFLFVHEQNERALAVYAAAAYRPDRSDARTSVEDVSASCGSSSSSSRSEKFTSRRQRRGEQRWAGSYRRLLPKTFEAAT